MSSKATAAVWESDLPRTQKYILLTLADHAKMDGTDIRPSIALVMWATGYDRRQVQTVIKELVDRGILRLVKRGGNGPKSTNEYALEYDRLPKLMNFPDWKETHLDADGLRVQPSAPMQNLQGCNFEKLRVQPSALELKALEPKALEATPVLNYELKLTPPEEDPDVLNQAIRQEVFPYYSQIMGKTVAYFLTERRLKQGKARLKEALKINEGDLLRAVGEMQDVIDHCAESDFHMARGQYKNNHEQNDWSQLFGSTDSFTKWADRARATPPKKKATHA